MMDYSENPCPHCSAHTLIYHQYIADSRCETCGEWEAEEREEEATQ